MACAVSNGRSHPVFGLWPVALRDELRRAMVENEEIRKVDVWTGRYHLVKVEFPEVVRSSGLLDPFFNTNRPEDLEDCRGVCGLAPVRPSRHSVACPENCRCASGRRLSRTAGGRAKARHGQRAEM